MTDYDIDVRELSPEYGPLADMRAGRETAAQATVLDSISVDVNIHWKRNGERYRRAYTAEFRVDHDAGRVVPKTVGRAHDKTDTLSVERTMVALDAARDAVADWLISIDHEYTVVRHTTLGDGAAATDPATHNALDAGDGDA
jgi:hypothetical protein